MRKFTTKLAVIVLGLTVLFKCTGNDHMFKTLKHTIFAGKLGPTINDMDLFPIRQISSGKNDLIPKGTGYGNYKIDSNIWKQIESYDPVGFLIIHQDKIVLEEYWDNYNDGSLVNSFSVAKSIVGLAVIKAIELGYIDSVDQKVIDFVPELEGDYREDVTIRHLLTMTSGIDFGESYWNPFGFMSRAYYGDNLLEKTLSYEAEEEPGSEWKYLGGNSILLSIIVNRASGETLSDFVTVNLWQKIGTPQNAYWNLDAEDGIEKAYCCFYSNLRDFGRLGLVVANNGLVFNKGRLNRELLAELKKPVVLNNGEVIEHYGWHWWRVVYEGTVVTYARGILGQYIIAIPDYNMVVVRLGTRRGKKNEFNHPKDLYLYLELAKSIHEQKLFP